MGDTFELADGRTLIGEAIGYNDNGLIVKLSAGNLQTERVSWARLSQQTLKTLSQNPKATKFVEPFIELTPEEKAQRAGLELKPVPRIEKTKRPSLVAALGTPIGFTIFLILYLANIYAGYEIALFRNQPIPLVAGIAAVAPLIGPAVFLAMPRRVTEAAANWDIQGEASPEPTSPLAPPPSRPSPVREYNPSSAPPPPPVFAVETPEVADLPPTQSYSRGQYTINRRFIETKFAGFLRVVPSESEKDLRLVINSARGQFTGSRIVRLTANELYLLAGPIGGPANEEMIPFSEISEIQIAHKDTLGGEV